MAAVIIAKDLYKCYPGFAPVLRGVNIELEARELAAIMGPSGCGKSTMLHVLGLLHKPDAGELNILGTDVLGLDREQTAAFRRSNLGFVMQSSNLFEHSTVFENVEFPLVYENVPPEERWERVIRALELVRLSARVHYRSNRLSGGEQQRVAIARAMVNNPRILLADEPTGALDAKTSRLIMENFRTLCHSGGVSMVLVTHDPAMAEFCDSIYTLEEGILKCQKRELAPLSAKPVRNLLLPRAALVRGAFVATRFPALDDPAQTAIAHDFHAADLLVRIYALKGSGFLSHSASYSLPMAVRSIGLWQGLGALLALFRQSGQGVLKLWRELPQGKTGFFRRLWAFACALKLARWGNEENIQFFYAAGSQSEATAAWAAAKLLNLPFAFAVRAKDLALCGQDWASKARDAVFVRCDSASGQSALRAFLPDLPAEKIVLLRNPLSLAPEEDEAQAEFGAGDAPLEILAAGRLERNFGYDLLLRALGALKAKGLDFRLYLVGEGADKLRLRWLALRLGLGKIVIFTGRLLPEQEAERYKKAAVFVSPLRGGPLADALPESLAEALAFGLACVVSDLPGQMEAVEAGSSGLVFAQNDWQELANALEKLIGNAAYRQSLGQNGRQRIQALLADPRPMEKLKKLLLTALDQTMEEMPPDSGAKNQAKLSKAD